MCNCKIITHSNLFKRTVKKLANKKGNELGLTPGSAEWSRMVIQVRRDLLKQISQTESQNNFIAPRLQLLSCVRLRNTTVLHSLKYTYKTEQNKSTLTIISDTDNLIPDVVIWYMNNRKKLITQATDAELIALDKLSLLNKIRVVHQKPFFICNHVYFADFYLDKYNVIIEIDGGYHRTQSQKRKDQERTAYLNSVGIKVVRLSNEDVTTMRLYEEIQHIVRTHQSSR